MKKLNLLLIPVILLMTAGEFYSCSNNGEEEIEDLPVCPLQGTKWKLAGFVNTATNKMTEAEPKDCGECYTLSFDTDTTATGYSVINLIFVKLNPSLKIAVATKVYDSMNGNVALYYEAMETVKSYTCSPTELKFFYNNKKNYLLFKLEK